MTRAQSQTYFEQKILSSKNLPKNREKIAVLKQSLNELLKGIYCLSSLDDKTHTGERSQH